MSILLDELTNDPLGRGYSGMSDLQVADSLNTANRLLGRKSISGPELFGYTEFTEYEILSDAKKDQWLGLCGIDTVTSNAVPLIKDIFPNGSTTWGNIVKTEIKTRAQELGFTVNEGDVLQARA